MPKGGRRPGAGRKRGSKTKNKSAIAIAIAEGCAQTGETPLEVMVAGMRYHYGLALAADPREVELHGMKLFNVKHTHFAAACEYAAKAAPYVHPRLNAVEHTGKDGGAIQHEHMAVREAKLAELMARVNGRTARASR